MRRSAKERFDSSQKKARRWASSQSKRHSRPHRARSRPCYDCSEGKAPVCKTMDYGKFRFELAKREKEARRKQHVVEVKEVRMTPGIDTHDFEVKQRHAARFLSDGNKVKVSVRFRGRAITPIYWRAATVAFL